MPPEPLLILGALVPLGLVILAVQLNRHLPPPPPPPPRQSPSWDQRVLDRVVDVLEAVGIAVGTVIHIAVERVFLWVHRIPRRDFEAWRAWRAKQDEDV